MRGRCKQSGIEIVPIGDPCGKGELIITTRASGQRLLHSQTGGFSHTMGFEPALHPNVPAFGLPDFGEFEGAITARTLTLVVTKTLFVLDGSGY